jgi:hypothetical protein
MKRNLISLIGVVVMASVLSLTLMPAFALASEEIGSLIKDQLEPVQDIYGQKEVTSKTLAESIANIVKIALSFLGILFLILILYGGFTWMTAAGNDDKISKAKDIIKAAVIGVAIVITAYAITYFVIDQLLMATGAEGIN